MEIEVREAGVDDAPGIARIHVTMWQYAYRGQIPDAYLDGLSIARRTTFWVSTLTKPTPRSHILVAISGDEITGFCSVGPSFEDDADVNTGKLYAIYVDPQFAGMGGGSVLMNEAIHALSEEGFTQATLWVLATNVRAQHFYERHGWVKDGTTQSEALGMDGIELQEIRYRRDL